MLLNVIIMTCVSIKVVSICTTTSSLIALVRHVSCQTFSLSLKVFSLVSELRIGLFWVRKRCHIIGLRRLLAQVELTVSVIVA